MISEFDVEADYYIDQAPDAVFVPNPSGHHKENLLKMPGLR
jgi:hypothetical protein